MVLLFSILLVSPNAIHTEAVIIRTLTVDSIQLACMTQNIMYEAGGESFLGQAAVARVVMNRVTMGFASTPCNVIRQSTTVQRENEDTGETEAVKLCQFSWVCADKKVLNKKSPQYEQASQIAYDVLVNDAYKDVVPDNTLFFHSKNVSTGWEYVRVAKIGNHVFYARD